MPGSTDNEREERVCVSGRSNDSEVFSRLRARQPCSPTLAAEVDTLHASTGALVHVCARVRVCVCVCMKELGVSASSVWSQSLVCTHRQSGAVQHGRGLCWQAVKKKKKKEGKERKDFLQDFYLQGGSVIIIALMTF